MDQREKELLDKLQAKTDEIKVPDSLKPEQIEKKLEGKKQKKWKRAYAYGLAAACCCVVIGAGALYSSGRNTDAITQNGSNAAGEPASKESGVKRNSIAAAESYDDIYDCFKEQQYDHARLKSDETVLLESGNGQTAGGASGTTETAAADTGGEGNFSETNVRQEGVAEGDIVKTDGTYLYVLKDNGYEIAIVDTKKAEMETVGVIKLDEEEAISELYIQEQKLIALYTKTKESESKTGVYNAKQYTGAVTYDISNPEKPKKLGEITQSGSYTTSRLTDGHLYLFSDYYVYNISARDKIDEYIPEIAGDAVASSKIYLPPMETANRYTVVSSMNIEEPDQVVDGRAILAKGGSVYVSNEHIYMYETEYRYGEVGNVTSTIIRKIAYNKGELEPVAVKEVPGMLNDSFSIDEYEGNLRIVATVEKGMQKSLDFKIGDDNPDIEYRVSNSLYILDESLDMIGKIENLAEEEQIYSARFMGDAGYFVTFKQIDPLFSVDLSDPKNPKILGELKIPGFSEYLHFYGENLLLGIGQAVDEDGGTSEGIKLSMFDISDPSDVKEIHKYVIAHAYSTDVFYDYKAALIDVEKNMIGFSAYSAQEHYYIFSYNEKNGFTNEFTEEVNGNSYRAARGVYINDMFYIVKGNIIESYSLKDYKKIDDIIL